MLRRYSIRMLGADARLARFGRYDLILPTDIVESIPITSFSPEFNSIHLHSKAEIAGISKASQLASTILFAASNMATEGTTTNHINNAIHHLIFKANAYPSPLGYKGFPKSICTSINNVLCHGFTRLISIPDHRKLLNGDIMNIDITVKLNGFHGDTSGTVLVGNVDAKGRKLVEDNRISLEKAIAICKHGVSFSEIGKVIEYIFLTREYADQNGYSVCPEFCGHGIGRNFHEPPYIQHTFQHSHEKMQTGMIFTIEPIFCQGSAKFRIWPDDWTAVTLDGGRTAQCEHTILIERDGARTLTIG